MGKLLPFNANNAEEYFISECVYWRDEANRIFQNDNAKRDSSNFVYSAEYQMAQGKYRAFQSVCEYMAKYDLSCCGCSNMVHSGLCIECKHNPEKTCVEGLCCDCAKTDNNSICGDYSENSKCTNKKDDGSCWEPKRMEE